MLERVWLVSRGAPKAPRLSSCHELEISNGNASDSPAADLNKVEKAFHNAFGPYRVNPRREFFSIEPEQAIGLLNLMKLKDMTPEMQREAEQVDTEAKASADKIKRTRRPSLNFLEMGLPEGARLDFVNGDHFCNVLNGRQVEHEGTCWALSYLTNKLLDHEGPIRGTAYWSYQGKPLTEIYDETYGAV